jgi:hypothetical protein
MSDGYVVGVGSLHQSGRTYQWVNDYHWKDVEDLPYAPDWVLEALREKWESQQKIAAKPQDYEADAEVPTQLLKGTLQEWWDGTVSAKHDDGSVDRSLTLWYIGLLLARQGAIFGEIVVSLRDRDFALGLQKFSDRRDGGDTEYFRIAQKVLAIIGDSDIPPDSPLEWADVVAAVGHDPASDNFYMAGSDGPRSRFILPTDRGRISNLRERLLSIWAENLVMQGKDVEFERSKRCGELKAWRCKRCGKVQCDGHCKPYLCKLRFCPRCVSVQARKPLWKKKAALEAEANLGIMLVRLGSYDVSGEGLYPVGSAKDIFDQAVGWLSRFAKLKDSPDTIKTSFSGFRIDLRQGWLTLELVILGPITPGASVAIRQYFSQAAERGTEAEVYPCRDAEDAINQFGNLMSSPMVYNTPDECQILMEAFSGRRIVTPRGRFMTARGATPETAGGSPPEQVVSIPGPPVDSIETNSGGDPPAGAGGGPEKPPRCHACGGETYSIGRVAGPWKKIPRGEFSGEAYWYLPEQPIGGRA